MHLPLHQVDAFADAVFAGNPAAVVPLERWIPDTLMQAIARANRVAEGKNNGVIANQHVMPCDRR